MLTKAEKLQALTRLQETNYSNTATRNKRRKNEFLRRICRRYRKF